MTLKEVIESGRMKVITSPPFNERRYEIHDKHHLEPIAFIENGAEIPPNLAQKIVWLGYHSDLQEEHTCVLCVK